MLTIADAYRKLEQFSPTVYDAMDNPLVMEKYAHRAYANIELYYECYKQICGAVSPGSRMLDIGAYPGTFLRLCKYVFFPEMNLELTGTGLILPEDEDNYRNKARKLSGINFASSPLGFKEYFSSIGIQFAEYELDYCFDDKPVAHEGGPYDIITCAEVIEHLHTPYKLITTIQRFLKPGGTCIIETNNVRNMNGILKLLLTDGSNLDFELIERYEREGYTTKRPHLRFYSVKEISFLLRKAGLEIESAYSFDWQIPRTMLKNKGSIADGAKCALRALLTAIFPGTKTHIMVKARKPRR